MVVPTTGDNIPLGEGGPGGRNFNRREGPTFRQICFEMNFDYQEAVALMRRVRDEVFLVNGRRLEIENLGVFHTREERKRSFRRGDNIFVAPERNVVAMQSPRRRSVKIIDSLEGTSIEVRLGKTLSGSRIATGVVTPTGFTQSSVSGNDQEPFGVRSLESIERREGGGVIVTGTSNGPPGNVGQSVPLAPQLIFNRQFGTYVSQGVTGGIVGGGINAVNNESSYTLRLVRWIVPPVLVDEVEGVSVTDANIVNLGFLSMVASQSEN